VKDGRGQERLVGWGFGRGAGVFGISARASGGAGGGPRLFSPALIEGVVRDRLRLSGIELGALVEVAGGGFLGGLVCSPTAGPHRSHGELGLGWPPGGMKERRGGRLADVGQDLCDGLGIGQECDECERCLTGWADQREDLVGTGFILHLLQRV
jgi:hypothetical protein